MKDDMYNENLEDSKLISYDLISRQIFIQN